MDLDKNPVKFPGRILLITSKRDHCATEAIVERGFISSPTTYWRAKLKGLGVVWLNEWTTSSRDRVYVGKCIFYDPKIMFFGHPYAGLGGRARLHGIFISVLLFSAGESTWRQEALESNSKNGINELQASVSG